MRQNMSREKIFLNSPICARSVWPSPGSGFSGTTKNTRNAAPSDSAERP
jgi:hypothetical protein